MCSIQFLMSYDIEVDPLLDQVSIMYLNCDETHMIQPYNESSTPHEHNKRTCQITYIAHQDVSLYYLFTIYPRLPHKEV